MTIIQAKIRKDFGRSANRRLRISYHKIPAILYGGNNNPQAIYVYHKEIDKIIKNGNIQFGIINLKIHKILENVIIKNIQYHPYKSHILHIDFQRISNTDIVIKKIPINFINSDKIKNKKSGYVIVYEIKQVEIICKAKDLPNSIDVDISTIESKQNIRLSEIHLPKYIKLTVDVKNPLYNSIIVSMHKSKISTSLEEIDKKN